MNVRYVGSPYHKRYPWLGQRPQLLSDKTECPADVVPSEAIRVLERGIRDGLRGGMHSNEETAGLAAYVWGRSVFMAAGKAREIVWEARLTNAELGEYKAYPIQEDRHHDSMPFAVYEALWPAN